MDFPMKNEIWDFPVMFPLNQSIEYNKILPSGIPPVNIQKTMKNHYF